MRASQCGRDLGREQREHGTCHALRIDAPSADRFTHDEAHRYSRPMVATKGGEPHLHSTRRSNVKDAALPIRSRLNVGWRGFSR